MDDCHLSYITKLKKKKKKIKKKKKKTLGMSNVSLIFFCDEPIKCGYFSDFVGGEFSPFCKN